MEMGVHEVQSMANPLSSRTKKNQSLEGIVSDRLRLIRVNLRLAILESFSPLILEIIQLKERLAFRQRSLRLSVK